MPCKRILIVIGQVGHKRNKSILSSDVEVVVDLPVSLADLARRVEETLEGVVEYEAGPE